MRITNVINRKGLVEEIKIEKIVNRIELLCKDRFYGKQLLNVDFMKVAIETVKTIYDQVETKLLDEQSWRIALGMNFINSEYEKLAARIIISSHVKNIKYLLGDDYIKNYVKELEGVIGPIYANCLLENLEFFNSLMNESNNYRYSFRGFFMLQNGSYLLKKSKSKVIIETPDMATIRVATALVSSHKSYLSGDDKDKIREIYEALSGGYYTHATPVLLNAGTAFPQFSSCFVMKIDDNLHSIMKHKYISAMCQKYSGGVGESWGSLRSAGAHIKSTNGVASGLVPLAKMTDKLGYYIDQGGGKRPGSISPYISDYHPDLLDTLELRTIENAQIAFEGHRLYYAVWVSGYFLDCVYEDKPWYFINPSDAPELENLFGDEFKKAYIEAIPKAVKMMPARKVMAEIINVQTNGVPYIVCKDNANIMRNQPVPIYSSNLCTEILIPANDKEVGVCNLASVSVKKYISKSGGFDGEYKNPINGIMYDFDEELLEKHIRLIVRSIDNTINHSFYPTEECKYSNMLRRPMGIGIMGLADALCKMGMVFGSDEACAFRARFEEAMTYYAYDESCELAKKHGPIIDHHLYKTGQGILHPLLFNEKWPVKYRFKKDWQALAEKIKTHGMGHSVMRADMPTGSTGVIMGNSPCFEPYESNIYKISAFAFDLVVFNKYLRRDLERFKMLTDRFINRFVGLSGSIQELNFKFFADTNTDVRIYEVEALIKKVYRASCFEVSPYEIMDMAIAAQPFIDQSQSMNLWCPTLSINTFNLYYYGYKRGLKTLCYYMKSSASTKKNICTNCVI